MFARVSSCASEAVYRQSIRHSLSFRPAQFRCLATAPPPAPATPNEDWVTLSNVHLRGEVKNVPMSKFTPALAWAKRSREEMKHLLDPPNAYAGRSIEVKGGDVAKSLGLLQSTLARNKVFSELKLAARHEKKGYKRRRLSSERWRRRFADEVRKKVQLVNEIRARGA